MPCFREHSRKPFAYKTGRPADQNIHIQISVYFKLPGWLPGKLHFKAKKRPPDKKTYTFAPFFKTTNNQEQ
jgi:hypothetical protein